MKQFLIVLLVVLFASEVRAQGNWETYMSQYGDKPGSVLVDLSQKAIAPDHRLPFLVVTGPSALKCAANGLPDAGEIDKMEVILSQTDDFLTSLTPKVLVGTFTYNCERLNYYYVKDTMDIRAAIHRMYRRGFEKYEFAINIKYDPEWEAYLTFLYPDAATFNWIENNRIITNMLQSGDTLTTPRNIFFHIAFPTSDLRSEFMEFAHQREYRVDSVTNDIGAHYMPFELIISKYSAITSDSIDNMSAEIKQKLKSVNGIYGGWTSGSK